MADTLVACKHNYRQSDSHVATRRLGTPFPSTPDLETVENTVVQWGYMTTPTLSAVPESADLNEQVHTVYLKNRRRKKIKLQGHV